MPPQSLQDDPEEATIKQWPLKKVLPRSFSPVAHFVRPFGQSSVRGCFERRARKKSPEWQSSFSTRVRAATESQPPEDCARTAARGPPVAQPLLAVGREEAGWSRSHSLVLSMPWSQALFSGHFFGHYSMPPGKKIPCTGTRNFFVLRIWIFRKFPNTNPQLLVTLPKGISQIELRHPWL